MVQLIRDWIKRHFSDPQVFILWFFLVLGFVVIFLVGNLLIPVFISVVVAYLLEGIVGVLRRWRVPRFPAVMAVFIVFMACLMILIIWLLPLLSRQIGQLVHQLPSMLTMGQRQLLQLLERYPDFISETQIGNILDMVNTGLTGLARQILSISLASVRGVITALIYLILVPFLVFFLLKDKEKIITWLKEFLPENRGLAVEVWQEVNLQVANYVRGKVWEILIIWIASYITFTILRLDFALLLSLFVGLSVLVPYIGVTVMFLPVILVAYFQWGWGSDFAYAIIAYSAIQLLDGNLLAPLLLSEVVDLHPVAIIVAVLLFGGLWGLWGLFFAIPLATLVNAVIKAWFKRPHRKEEPGNDLSSAA